MKEDTRAAKRARRSVRLSGWAQSSDRAQTRSTVVDISHLDGAVLGLVLSKLLDAQDICNAMRTCRAMAEAGRSRMVWRELSLRLEEEKSLDEMEATHGGAREAFKLLARDPVKRFRFIKRIPTLGLNASDDDLSPGERRAAVHGGFSFVPPTEGQAETNRAGLADYNSFGVREFVFPRVGRDERLWLCEDRLTGEAKAVKVVMMGDKPNEGLPCRKLREVANLRALRNAPGIATPEMTLTTTSPLPLPHISAFRPGEPKLLLVHHHFPCNMRAQWTRMCGNPGDDGYAASCRPPRAWTDPNSATLTRERTRTVMRQVLRALEHAHSRGICHRNLHSGHLLLDPAADGGCGRVAIASWSSSRRLQTPPAPVSPLRTCTVPYNVAPEGLLHHETIEDEYADENQPDLDDGYGDGETYGPEVDVWSAGCIFAELRLGHSLFNKFSYAQGARTLDQLLSIFKLFGTPRAATWDDVDHLEGWSGDSYPRWMPRSLLDVFPDGSIGPLSADLLWRLMALDPRKRITARQALRHPYFTAPIDADASGFVRGAKRTAPGVVHAVARGTKRPIRKRRAREGTNDDDDNANRERAKDRGRERADDEEKECNEDEEADAGRWTREVGAAAEAESPSEDETDAAIRKKLVELGLPLGSSVVGRYVIDFTSPLTRQRWAFGIIVGYDKGENMYTVECADTPTVHLSLTEEDVIRHLLI